MTVQPYAKLAKLNEMSPADVQGVFFACSGSPVWAAAMTAGRPYIMIESLFSTAELAWRSVPRAHRIEAYAIAEKWIADFESEEGSVSGLSEAKRLYRDKFGFDFILAPSERSSAEVLAICRSRLGNSVQTEDSNAAAQHSKIIESRLNQLLER